MENIFWVRVTKHLRKCVAAFKRSVSYFEFDSLAVLKQLKRHVILEIIITGDVAYHLCIFIKQIVLSPG